MAITRSPGKANKNKPARAHLGVASKLTLIKFAQFRA